MDKKSLGGARGGVLEARICWEAFDTKNFWLSRGLNARIKAQRVSGAPLPATILADIFAEPAAGNKLCQVL